MVSGGGYYRQVLYELTTVWFDPGDGAFQNLLEKQILKLFYLFIADRVVQRWMTVKTARRMKAIHASLIPQACSTGVPSNHSQPAL